MYQIRVINVTSCFLVFVALLSAGTYYVDDNGTASWAACEHNAGTPGPKSGTNACNLKTANANVAPGDTVYLRSGTYTITDDGISPSHSGSAGNIITFSGYASEVVTILGATGLTGYASRGIWLNNKSYIKITKIIFSNVYRFFGIAGGGHNEISYCTATFRDPWNDIKETGTATNSTPSSTVLENSAANWTPNTTSITSSRLYNATDKSTTYQPNYNTSNTIVSTSYPLAGGTDNLWTKGDVYEITQVYPYNDAPCNIENASTHNFIHHNTIHGMGGFTEQSDGSPLFQIGADFGGPDYNNNNTIEYNHIYHGGHHVLGINLGLYTVIRNNFIHNEAWFDDASYSGNCHDLGLCGYRNVSCNVDDASYGGRGLWENNTIGYGSQYGGYHLYIGASGSGTTLATPFNIYRYNQHIGNAMYGLRFGSSISGGGNNNCVYNNTFYKNGYRVGTDPYRQDEYACAIFFNGLSDGNNLKNNLVYDHWSQTNKTGATYWPGITAGNSCQIATQNVADNTISGNYVNTNSGTYFSSASPLSEMRNPLFVNSVLPANIVEILASWSNYAVTSPNLSLQVVSPAIDGGTYLTQTNGSDTNSLVLKVDNATYFQDGTWGSDLARATLHADWIAIGTVSDSVQISSINYTSNTITLTSAKTWKNKAKVWLYKISDGTRVLYGNAPDFGAHESKVTNAKPPATTGLGITK